MRALLAALLVLGGCEETVRLDRDAGPAPDARGQPDAMVQSPCRADGDAQCSNCEDDDGDQFVDGHDPHCAGPLDDDEATFATGIPGDNKDRFKQDCFFDGNSGGSCQIDTCCLLDEETCLAGDYGDWPPADCAFSASCAAACADLTPPGCDCFGCCTICHPDTDQCYDVLTNPAVSDGCDFDSLSDPDVCIPCTKFGSCTGGECDPQKCILCQGQTEEDLPRDCDQMNACPGGETPCDTSSDCAENEYCANRCCVEIVE
ncbi:MAG TPA: hypothetical protein VFU21_04100 [Kofleriaceae bacterium]|nr:hypothetical protein [Kofleriaceae bacterium]